MYRGHWSALTDTTESDAMTKRRKKMLVVGAGVLAISVPLVFYVLRPRSPRTIAEALARHPEQFPEPQIVLLPLSSEERIGRRIPDLDEKRHTGHTDPASCFFVRRVESPGLSRLDVEYRDEASMRLELQGGLSQFGVGTSDQGLATLGIEGVRIVSGVGIPNPNGPCGSFENTTTLKVVTSEIVATRLVLKMKHVTSGKAQGSSSATSDGGADGSPSGSSGSEWTASSESTVEGANVVLSGFLTDVTVTVSIPPPKNLGTTPHVGDVVPFPTGFDGSITVGEYDDPTQRLSLSANTLLFSKEISSTTETYQTCSDEKTALTPGKRCLYWLKPGNAAVAAWWEPRRRADDVTEIWLVTKGYRTNFVK